jgi:hypothetical protein
MAEIRKNYVTKFPREVIEEAYRVFKERVGENGRLSFAEWHITHGDEQLTLDSDNEFYYGYRDEIDDASLKYTYVIDNILYTFSITYSKIKLKRDSIQINEKSNIVISLKSQDDVRLVFNVFDKNYTNPVEKIDPGKSAKAAEMPKYSVEKQIPSCHVDKNLLIGIENYFKKIAEEYKMSGFIIKILDSNGTEELPNIENFNSDYFPNDVRNISINSGNYNAKLSIIFDRKKEKSKLEISIMGDQAREKASSISAEIMRMLDDYKTKNYIFHAISPGDSIFLTVMPTAVVLAITLLILKNMIQTFALVLGIILLMEITYAIFSYLNTYTTFKTKNYESYMGWKNWLTFAFIEFLLFGVGGAVLLKHFGF